MKNTLIYNLLTNSGASMISPTGLNCLSGQSAYWPGIKGIYKLLIASVQGEGGKRRREEGGGGREQCYIVWCEPKYEKCDDDGVMLHSNPMPSALT